MSAGKRALKGRRAKGSGRASSTRVSQARRAAFEILRRVEEEGAYASVLLSSNEDGLRADDLALAYEIVLGVLRHQLWLDRLIEHYTGRASDRLDAPVRRSLRMGLYQLRLLSRIPASAIVNESVNLAHMARLSSAAGLINAALRRAAREPEYDPAANIKEPLEGIAVKYSHPLWLIKRWAQWLGLEEAERLAEANNLAPPVAFRVVESREGSETVMDELSGAGARLEKSLIAPGAWRVEGAQAQLRSMAQAGRIYIQDEASQMVAHLVGAQGGELILDSCAAPGSKTSHIADLSKDEALIVACDLHLHRLRPLVEGVARQGFRNIRAVVHDASRALPFVSEAFDRVLVDAPCTGTGTLRRNPEIRWRIRAEDIQALQARQSLILRNSSRAVRQGGRLIYSTCSIEPEENEEVVARFLQEESGWRQVAAHEAASKEGIAVRTWPHRGGADGFFLAAFERA